MFTFTKKDAQALRAEYEAKMCSGCLYQPGCHRTLHITLISDESRKVKCDHYVLRPDEGVVNQVYPGEKNVGGVKYGG